MNASVITALAALAGAAIGGLTSVVASWLTQQMQARTRQLVRDLGRRQKLYKDFIEDASRFYVDALQHDKADVSSLIGLYAMISRMRVLSSPKVIESADKIARTIVDTYLAPNKTFPELREMMVKGALDPLRDFSEACRTELQSLRLR